MGLEGISPFSSLFLRESPFFGGNLPFFGGNLPFFGAFLRFFGALSQNKGQKTAIYWKNGEFHSDPVCTDPVENFPKYGGVLWEILERRFSKGMSAKDFMTLLMRATRHTRLVTDASAANPTQSIETPVSAQGPNHQKGRKGAGVKGAGVANCRKLSHFSFCCAFRCCVVYSPCFPVWGEEKVMTIYDAGPLAAGPLCGLLKSEVSKRGWRTEGVVAKTFFLCQRLRPLFCTLFPMPP